LPVVGLFLGGEKEGLVGVTYEVVGHPGAPVLHVNPLSALAPGLLRKVFEFPANELPTPPAEVPGEEYQQQGYQQPGYQYQEQGYQR
jgi:hypothetical protein